MNELKKYLFFKQISITNFSATLKISRRYLNQIVLSKAKPSRLLAEEIERKTNGEVKAEDLLKGDL